MLSNHRHSSLFLKHGLVSLLWFGICLNLQAADDLHVGELRDVQQRISDVVGKNMNACVAVTDGVGFGSGVIVSPDGLVLTAGHVMAESNGKYEIILPTGRTVEAKPLGKNLNVDSGMVQIIEPGPWPYVDVGRAKKHRPGEWVVSLGHSGGFELGRLPPVRSGRILAQEGHQLLTDAVLIGGDSGGPLFDLDGNLIAIHSSIGDSIAENRHVTIATYHRDWSRLKSGESWGELPELNEPGDSQRPGKIGVQVDRSAPQARIKSVNRGTSAEEVGIRTDDIVTNFDGIAIRDGNHLIEVVKNKSAGDVCPISILRNGKAISFEIQLR